MIWTLHGAVGMAADWREFADSLPPELGGVRRLDLWRFLDCCPMPLEKIGATLVGEIKRIDPEPTLVAYSMGGRLALHALLAEPDVWKSAIIISAHPGLIDEDERAARREKDAAWSALALKGEWSEFLEKWETQNVLSGAGDMPDRAPLKTRRASIARSFIDWSLGAQANLVPELNRITCPTLWLTGGQDSKFTEIAKAAVPDIPHAEHIILPDSGHRIPWEKPSEFSKLVREFIT
jgi:2-succinyl-6-hydroxy-2,4-cyclohexadiene-1-carboxylate synthase